VCEERLDLPLFRDRKQFGRSTHERCLEYHGRPARCVP
jgi:hypothetical protein